MRRLMRWWVPPEITLMVLVLALVYVLGANSVLAWIAYLWPHNPFGWVHIF